MLLRRRRRRRHQLIHHLRRGYATKYSGRIVKETSNGRLFAVEVDSPTFQTDSRGYALPRRDLICKSLRILQSRSPAADPFLDLSDYFQTLNLILTTSEASEILKSLSSHTLALQFFHFFPLTIPKFKHDVFTCNRMFLILSKSSSEDRFGCVRHIVDEMERSGVRGAISTINILIGIYGGTEEELERCLGLVSKWELRMNGYPYKCLLQAYLRCRDSDKAWEVYREIRGLGYVLDIFAYNMLLDSLAKDEKVDQALKIFKDMKRKHCEPDEYTYTIMIRMTGRCYLGAG